MDTSICRLFIYSTIFSASTSFLFQFLVPCFTCNGVVMVIKIDYFIVFQLRIVSLYDELFDTIQNWRTDFIWYIMLYDRGYSYDI